MGDSNLIDRYRRWFDYEKDAHIKVLASLDSVPEENLSSREYQKALTIMAHIMAARQLWLFRFGVNSDKPKDFFPTGLTLPDVIERVEQVHTTWSSYLERLSDSDLARAFDYESLDGGRFRNTVEDILTQLFGHSWYHRGQIASLVRAAGGEPAITDFVFWTREPIK
jgi:uncharacterized damage-inducible protein DinB